MKANEKGHTDIVSCWKMPVQKQEYRKEGSGNSSGVIKRQPCDRKNSIE